MTLFHIVPILAAGLVPLIVGYLWYHPRIFGSRWMQLKHITPEMVERNALRSAEHTIVVLVSGMALAYVLALILSATGIETVLGVVFISGALWLGIVVPVTIASVLWDHKPIALYAIETGQWLFTIAIMSLVLMM